MSGDLKLAAACRLEVAMVAKCVTGRAGDGDPFRLIIAIT